MWGVSICELQKFVAVHQGSMLCNGDGGTIETNVLSRS